MLEYNKSFSNLTKILDECIKREQEKRELSRSLAVKAINQILQSYCILKKRTNAFSLHMSFTNKSSYQAINIDNCEAEIDIPKEKIEVSFGLKSPNDFKTTIDATGEANPEIQTLESMLDIFKEWFDKISVELSKL